MIARFSNRRRIVTINPELLCKWLSDLCEGITLADGIFMHATENGIPATAVGLRCRVNARGDIELLIADESFAEVPEGAAAPQPRIVFQSKYPEVETHDIESRR